MLGSLSLTRPRRVLIAALGAVALLAPVQIAQADTFVDVYKDFQKDGVIDACRWTAKQLRTTRDQVPPDIEQYAPDFPAALALAIEQRGSGNCRKSATQTTSTEPAVVAPGTTTPTTTPGTGTASSPTVPGQPAVTPTATTGTPQPSPAPAPAAVASDGAIEKAASGTPASGRSDDLPAAVVGLGALLAVLVLVALAWLVARTLAWEPVWWPRARHAVQEAGWRVSGTWADFTDWVRLGR